jgi:mannose-6-phosphate isomerase-like protein (cupin superfamily)
MKEGKIWGSTQVILSNPFVSIHRLTIKPNAHCSLHCHEFRWNAFLVLSGRLTVEVYQKKYSLIDSTELGPGDDTTVRPGLWHRFLTGNEAADVLEIYYPEALADSDIVRKDVGGIVEAPEAQRHDVFGNIIVKRAS